MTEVRDHGGNLDAAIARLGGDPADWLDLSTGINPEPYPVPPISGDAWAVLPRKSDLARLRDAAASAYATSLRVIPMNGAQGAIQLVPRLAQPGRAAIMAPTYNEHGAALRTCGWQVEEVASADGLWGADLAVVVNPNNPDGRRAAPEALIDLAAGVGLLIVDESFVDPEPHLSIGSRDCPANCVVLRSFGKFYGLAGLRLGFALASGAVADHLADLAGPWPVSGPAIEIACAALADNEWQARAVERLTQDAARLDSLASDAGWTLVGGTPLFRTYDVAEAHRAQESLAINRVWSRIFPYSDRWLRLGLPPQTRWQQLEEAIGAA
ncbi:Histidinol-phosphate aminotransferase [Roseovarius sp. THAF9]|uniref:threonine-phosphate decarboxylase CobD n=1 Tax=Roseovarius sp. THAF9 TaxID=2587847 RepID=UPI001268263D|nr:threonine-phosphate decarboxylase CobD [Roseovarius sp. THAF9]QFT91753.1 Histidinol-phosphate aminotransferase [Roseovarius sp. THAF9]